MTAAETGTSAAPPLLGPWRARITRADAFAWENLPRELRGWRNLVFFLFLGSAGIWVALLEEVLPLDGSFGLTLAAILAAAGLHWLIATAFMTRRTHARAARRIPTTAEIEVEDHGDRLLARTRPEAGPERIDGIPFDRVGQVLATETHLFLAHGAEVVILPLAAFASLEAMRAIADDWDRRADAASP